MVNPYHDAVGRFCSANKMRNSISQLMGAGQPKEAYELAAEYFEIQQKDSPKKPLTNNDGEPLVMKHGVLVVPGKIATSTFIRGFNNRVGSESYYTGSWSELENLVKTYWAEQEPGTGSVNGDVILVNVPAEGFHTPIAKITPENVHLVEEVEEVRVEGEKPVTKKVICGIKPPAKVVKIVCYRADVLAQDNDRSTDAEWELIAINAQQDQVTPMTPATMLRNSNHDEGGTERSYNEKEWADAYSYWDSHAFIIEK